MHELYQDRETIERWLRRLDIRHYTLIGDDQRGYEVSVEGDVNLCSQNITKIAVQFSEVTGYFACSHNKLKSLYGAPRVVGKDFVCNKNMITSLEFGPHTVGGDYSCALNLLTSLHGAPLTIEKNFICSYNQISSFEGGPLVIGQDFIVDNNKFTDFLHFPKVGKGLALNQNTQLWSYQNVKTYEELKSILEKQQLNAMVEAGLRAKVIKV